jgi:hypothetical protein
MSDSLLDLIAGLPQASVTPERAARTQSRCHRVLARRAPRPATRRPARWWVWFHELIEGTNDHEMFSKP